MPAAAPSALLDMIGDSITGIDPLPGKLLGGVGGDDDDEHALGARMDGSVEIVHWYDVVQHPHLQTRWRDALAEGE